MATERFDCYLGYAGSGGNWVDNCRGIRLRTIPLLNDHIHAADSLCDLADCVAFSGD